MAAATATLTLLPFPRPVRAPGSATAQRRHGHLSFSREGAYYARVPRSRSATTVSSPLIPASDHWGNWTFLLTTAAVGIWSEKSTPVGKALSAALVSVLLGLAASSAGVVAADAPAYHVVLDYLLPLAIPLLLFSADLRRVLRSTGDLLRSFLLGSLPTTIGTVVAFVLVPMRSLGQDNWKIAAALMSRHIGGAVNYVAVSEALEVSPSVQAAGLAADNVFCALYFTSLFALAAKIPAQDSRPTAGDDGQGGSGGDKLPALQSAMAMAVAFAICKAGKLTTSLLGIQGGSLPCITAIAVALATLFPSHFGKLAPSGVLYCCWS